MNINQQNLLISKRFRKKSLKIVNNPDFFENRVNSYKFPNKINYLLKATRFFILLKRNSRKPKQ